MSPDAASGMSANTRAAVRAPVPPATRRAISAVIGAYSLSFSRAKQLTKSVRLNRAIAVAELDGPEVFHDVDPDRWHQCGRNPVRLLQEADFYDASVAESQALARERLGFDVVARQLEDFFAKF